jgi:hypothetical protein
VKRQLATRKWNEKEQAGYIVDDLAGKACMKEIRSESSGILFSD